ncbi:MAG: ABC transporter ATP-binding protein [Proteobacteria bacterium]|nr:ABC transporter ATP-binding protein [Pseudomonadota bacterium]
MSVLIDRLKVTYREGEHALLALDRVSLSLNPGRVTALVGESGSGKTTLGRSIMGLLPLNAEAGGRIRLEGRDLLGLDEAALNELRWTRMAMVFQNGAANLNPVYPLVDQVAEPLVQHGGRKRNAARNQARAAIEAMGLPADLGSRYPHQLSGGQIQRALLAMALILNPKVLILDEPTASLDALTKTFMSDQIDDMRRRGQAVLLITHDLDLASILADDLAVLYLGRIMEIMPAGDLLAGPEHPYTAALSRSYPSLDAVRDLGGIRGDAFYRLIHAHPRPGHDDHDHVVSPDSIHETGHAPRQGCLFQPRCTQAVDECRLSDVPMIEAGRHQVRCLRRGIVNLLELEGVEKRYGSLTALTSTNLTLKAGELFCLVGETGSGKTTLAMLAAGALHPDRGRRTFEGRDMDTWLKRDYPSLASKIGLIYQSPAESVSHRFSVFDVVAEPLRVQRPDLPRADLDDRVRRALTDVRLSTEPEFLKRYPHELNMGAIQRLCLARAIVHDPVLIVADEPTSSLDPSVQAKVLRMLLNLQIERGLTMLFVTHDLGLARKIADRVGVMLAGRMVELGPAARVMGRPGHPYTRMLISGGRARPSVLHPVGLQEKAPVCPFIDRCDRFETGCLTRPPSPVNLEGGRHLAWCRHPLNEVAEAMEYTDMHADPGRPISRYAI